MIIDDLVFDIGAHIGGDTIQYLRMGYRVIAVEASPLMATTLRERFSEEIAKDRVILVEKAISEKAGTIPFHLHQNTAWSSIHHNRWSPEQSVYETIEVQSLPFDELIHQFGTPLYVKVDIEGGEPELVEGLARVEELPPFISVEFCDLDLPSLLSKVGYRDFQIIPQEGLAWTGPFGDDLPNIWISAEQAASEGRRIWAAAPSNFWCDLHARLSPNDTDPTG